MPFTLLSVKYKLLERLLFNRLSPIIVETLPVDQAGQVLLLRAYIEQGFEKHLKPGSVFVFMTAAYNTVWRVGLIYKFLEVIEHFFQTT